MRTLAQVKAAAAHTRRLSVRCFSPILAKIGEKHLTDKTEPAKEKINPESRGIPW
jgi:hypothetical protein